MLHLDNLKKQAKQIVRWHREGYYPIAQRIRAGLPRFHDVDDPTILSKSFALSDAQELIARELGFESWQVLRIADLSSLRPVEHWRGNEPQLLGAHPQLFVSDVEASCRFFVTKLGFTVRFEYGKPAFYALVQRDCAYLNLRYVHAPVLNRGVERDLLSASIPVGNIKALYSEYQSVDTPMHQRLKKQPWGTEDFIVRDSDGNLIHFAQSVGPPDV
ncbi:MAG TPA: VOC family protein, partial [Bryobacteraceae bacterium]|nr:VOC family protein [Bryobacteraceae bacterium]